MAQRVLASSLQPCLVSYGRQAVQRAPRCLRFASLPAALRPRVPAAAPAVALSCRAMRAVR